MRSHQIRTGPKSNDWGLYKKKEGDLRHRGSHVKTEAGGNAATAQGCLEPPEAAETRKDPPEGAQPCRHFDFGLLASKPVRGEMCVVSSHPVCGHCCDGLRDLIQIRSIIPIL